MGDILYMLGYSYTYTYGEERSIQIHSEDLRGQDENFTRFLLYDVVDTRYLATYAGDKMRKVCGTT